MTEFKFCLVMIVRDESNIIQRCLESIKNLADCYFICDTGSKDDTISKITTIMQGFNKPGKIITAEWKNFGWNKSYLLEKFREDPIFSKSKYIFWMDADEVFITDKNNPSSYLTPEDVNNLYYLLESKNEPIFSFLTLFGGLEYQRRQIARNNQVYKWYYPVHEIFAGEKDDRVAYLSNIYDLARKEGNSSKNPDRYHHDIKMFEDYLLEKPNDTRATFYLAQSAESVGDNKKAIEYYKKRVDLGGYYDEEYISCLRLGRLIQDETEKKHYWLMAISKNKIRLETIYELMMMYYNRGEHKKAFEIGLMAGDNRSTHNILFAEANIYNWQFDIFFSISAYYSEQYKLAYKIGKSLLERKAYPSYSEAQIKGNLDFYKSKLSSDYLDLIEGKTTPLPPLPSIVVIDNFYDNPDEVRKFALSQKFEVKGNYPGIRTNSLATQEHRQKIEKILGRKISYWPQGYNGSFQITTKYDMSWIHRDATDYSLLVFLTPDPPADGGTIVYRHKELKQSQCLDKKSEDIMNNDTYNPDKWEVIDKIGNLYNRAILFNGKQSHMSDKYFGENPQNGRLFQTFFFDVEK